MGASSFIGRRGRVTGRVAPGTTGEVSVQDGHGGTQALLAYPADGQEVLERNTMAIVVEYVPPRTVYVTDGSGTL